MLFANSNFLQQKSPACENSFNGRQHETDLFHKKFEVPVSRLPIFFKTKMMTIHRKIAISVILETDFASLPLLSEIEMT